MARGYPEPKEPQANTMPPLVAEGQCVICKRRAAQAPSDKCGTCAEALSRH